MIESFKAVLLDGNFKSYWLSRAMTVAVSVLFGVFLKEMGYDSLTVVLAWSALLFIQTLQLFGLGLISEHRQHQLSHWGGWFSIACAIWMIAFGPSLVPFFLLILAQVPAVREGVISGMVYVRIREDWPLGPDVASAVMNETAKIFGAVIIGVLAVVMGASITGLMLCMIAVVVIILWTFPTLPESDGQDGGPLPGVGDTARKYLWISFVHNGCIIGLQSYLTLAMYDLLKASGFGSATIGVLGTMLALMMLLGLMVYATLRKRAGKSVAEPGRSPLFLLSMLSLALVSVMAFVIIVLWQAGSITPLTTAIAIGCVNGLLAALVGLYSVGTFQLMDASYRHLTVSDKSARLRIVFHLNMTVAHLAPSLILLMMYLGFRYLTDMTQLSIVVTGIVAVVECVLVGSSLKLARFAERNPERSTLPASTAHE